jgi:O-antigen/teichoic acid export membrane protein
VCAWLWVLIFFDIKSLSARNSLPRLNEIIGVIRLKKEILSLFLIQIPLGVATCLNAFSVSAPRLILETQQDLNALAVFFALFYVFQAAQTLLQAFLQVYLRQMSIDIQKGNLADGCKSMVSLCSLLCITILAVFMIIDKFGALLLMFLYGEQFSGHELLFVVLAIAWSLRFIALVPRQLIYANRNFKITLALDFLTGLVVVVCCLIGAHAANGTLGVAYGFLTGQGIFLLLYIVTLVFLLIRQRRSY